MDFFTKGVLVLPPTITIVSISPIFNAASRSAFLQQTIVSFTSGVISVSNSFTDKRQTISLILSSKISLADKCFLAVSAFNRSVCINCLSTVSTAILFVCNQCSTIKRSKSSPPKKVLPLVAKTSKYPPSFSDGVSCKIDISKVPPPKS